MVGPATVPSPGGGFSFASLPAFAHAEVVEDSSRKSRQLFWLFQTGGWLLLIPLSVSVTVLVFRDPGTIILIGVVRQILGFCLTLGLWRYYRRWPAASFKLTRHAWQIALACMLAAAADNLITALLHDVLALAPIPLYVERGSMLSRLALYLMWSALYFVIRQELETRATELRLARAEAANREAEIQFLRAQVNPHFLFNALNTIIALAETNPSKVADTTHSVADYLRYSLSHSNHRAPLGEELTAMANYLKVECAGFGSARLDWRIEATDEARAATVPTALVQPLIENALKYGLRTSPLPLRLRVHAHLEAGEAVVTVENSGTWITRAPGEKHRDSTGIGLGNLRRRLELLCGPTARLETSSSVAGVRVEVRLPVAPPAAG